MQDAHLLDDRSLLFTVGHNEYWSWAMRDHVDQFVQAGGNWAILSGNTCFWQVRYGADHGSMISHKTDARVADPVAGSAEQHLLTSMWSDPLIGRPETSTIGLTFSRGGYHRVGDAVPRGAGGYTVVAPEHWVFAGTDLRYGDVVGATGDRRRVRGRRLRLHGRRTAGRCRPVRTERRTSLVVLATAPARLISITADHCEAPAALWASVAPPGDLEWVASILFGDDATAGIDRLAHGHAVMGVFQNGKGTVFNAGSANWCYGLGADAGIERITRNVVERLGARD